MTALALARSSLRFRATAFAASFLAVLLGAAIVMAFASLIDTASGAAVASGDEETLVTMATVVGFWGLVIVVFAVTSTLTLSVRQRAREIALLKSVGATPAQVTRMVVGEAAGVGLVAAVAAIPLGYAGGALLLAVLQDTGQIGPAVDHRFGGAALTMGTLIPLVAAMAAAVLASRRAARMQARDAMSAATDEAPRLSRKRAVAGVLLVLLGVDLGVVTATVFDGKGIDAMQTAGQAGIWASLGLALLAPAMVRRVIPVRVGPLEPIVVFTGIAVGCLSMQSIENGATSPGATTMTASEAQDVETLNFVVVGMLALFAGITVVNSLVAATTYRRREFAQLRLAGATPGQVLGMVARESGVLVVAGVVLGSLASLVTIVPYSLARTGQLLPDQSPVIWLVVVASTAALTFAASLGAARRAISEPAITAVAA